MTNNKTGSYMAALRKEKHLTQKQLALMMDVTKRSVSNWESGRSLPDIGTFPALAEILGTSVETLINGGDMKDGQENSGREFVRHLIQKRLWKQKKICLLALMIGIAGIILARNIWTSSYNGQQSLMAEYMAGTFCQLLSFCIYKISSMSIAAEINRYNNIYKEELMPAQSKVNFYIIAVWVWTAIPIWFFVSYFAERKSPFLLTQIIHLVRMMRNIPDNSVVPLNNYILFVFLIVYAGCCILLSIGMLLARKFRRSRIR